jgi:hypothetical protein
VFHDLGGDVGDVHCVHGRLGGGRVDDGGDLGGGGVHHGDFGGDAAYPPCVVGVVGVVGVVVGAAGGDCEHDGQRAVAQKREGPPRHQK